MSHDGAGADPMWADAPVRGCTVSAGLQRARPLMSVSVRSLAACHEPFTPRSLGGRRGMFTNGPRNEPTWTSRRHTRRFATTDRGPLGS